LLIVLSRILAPRFPSLPSFLSSFTFVLLLAFFLGAARYQISVPRFNAFHIAFYNDREYDLLITGTVIEPPDYRDNYTNLRLQVSNVDTGDRDLPASGLLLVRASKNQIFHYGDILRVRGKLKTPPENEDFSYRDYLAAQHIHSYMSSAEVRSVAAALILLRCTSSKKASNIIACSQTRVIVDGGDLTRNDFG
jgi:hypothetical protein